MGRWEVHHVRLFRTALETSINRIDGIVKGVTGQTRPGSMNLIEENNIIETAIERDKMEMLGE
jgi:hypothetical protein